MSRTFSPQDLVDSTVVDQEGSKIGKVGTVYLADSTREPEWITVKTGLFGTKESFVPLSGAGMDDDGLHVSVAKDQVSEAPRMDVDGHLSPADSAELYRHYGLPMPRSSPEPTTGTQAAAGTTGRARDTGRENAKAPKATETDAAAKSGKHNASGEDAMIRSEERLVAGTEQVETGRVRLHKYVVTEEQQVTVPVRHEEVRVEREPITRADGGGRAEIGEQDHEVTLHAEKAVVRKETVPMEKVRLQTESVTGEETVSGEVRKEQIEVTDEGTRRDKS
ncbi:PRC and DUF2382 domain-containing protein [Amycolatopsis sp. H20-H5]|uniref:PRC and DUF2382 domain-containing protein n=1 Tax=Amycolatopsis sp. H20-H5 TaxID=3046309 RepID=UPI002DBA6D8B|nr:PRC and DUF2382 domain-containing protein [Amycolatopsis sp. H20-H5]MEC3980910.1 PRC and DUF2382 domain-containing protein [Amycolatopsis sp. H20-H5]